MPIRVARHSDIPALFHVRTSVRDNRMDLAELAAAGITPETLPAMLSGAGRGWVAEIDGEVVAFAMADAQEACVFALFALPGHEGRGLGRRLLAQAERWLFAQGCAQIWLLTDADRSVRANGFYRHLGWHDDGVQPDGQTRFSKRAPFAVRPMHASDLPGVLAIQAEAYAGAAFAPEQPEVYTDRMAVAPDLCLVAVDDAGALLGYLVSHPWHDGSPPGLDMRLVVLPPDCACWYLHDCAVAAEAHGQGVAAALYEAACSTAVAQGLRTAALVAVGDAAGYWHTLGYAAQHRPALSEKLRGYGAGARYMVRALAP